MKFGIDGKTIAFNGKMCKIYSLLKYKFNLKSLFKVQLMQFIIYILFNWQFVEIKRGVVFFLHYAIYARWKFET